MIFFIYFIVVFIIFACLVILFSPAKDIPFDDIIVVPVLIILVLSIITFVSLGFNTKFELVYDGDWKQIYSNNIKADIDISLKDGTILKTYKPGEKFGDKKIIQTNQPYLQLYGFKFPSIPNLLCFLVNKTKKM